MEAKGDKGEEVKDPAERTRKKGIKYQKSEAKETQEAVDKKWVKLRGMTQVKEVPDRSQAEATVEVQKFLTKLQLREADDGEFGTTWLELFTLYKALGHPCPVKDPLKKAQGKPSLGAQLNSFKLATRRLAKQKLCTQDQKLFKACQRKGYALRRLGVSSRVSMIAGVVRLTSEVQDSLDKELLVAEARERKGSCNSKARKKSKSASSA